MSREDHQRLAQFIKQVHASLRNASSKMGARQAWQDHCENKHILRAYARNMEKLATTHWVDNCANKTSGAASRIDWTANLCYDYFVNKSFLQFRQKEVKIAGKMNVALKAEESFSQPVKLIDVGSCYNPFKTFQFLDVFAIDLCPGNNSVLECDFLEVSIGPTTKVVNNKVNQIQQHYFDVVTFCFLLEYIPSSELRIDACEKAYYILKPGGLLIINTPDSKHVGANSKLMKCWQYTLANIGFTRIKYEKLKHMHCMAFRKALNRDTAVRWAETHKEPYMKYSIHIPQDFQNNNEEMPLTFAKYEISPNDFKELPFSNFDTLMGISA